MTFTWAKLNANLHWTPGGQKKVSSSFQLGSADKFGIWPNQANLISLGWPNSSLSLAHVKYDISS